MGNRSCCGSGVLEYTSGRESTRCPLMNLVLMPPTSPVSKFCHWSWAKMRLGEVRSLVVDAPMSIPAPVVFLGLVISPERASKKRVPLCPGSLGSWQTGVPFNCLLLVAGFSPCRQLLIELHSWTRGLLPAQHSRSFDQLIMDNPSCFSSHYPGANPGWRAGNPQPDGKNIARIT